VVAAGGWLLEDKHVNSTVSLDIIGLRHNKSQLSVVDVNNKHNA